jgi:cell pole-organizing protein PopZ
MGSQNLKVNEPSMEDILASIRRIIADDMDPVHEPEVRAAAPTSLKSVLDIAESHVTVQHNAEPFEAEQVSEAEIHSFQEEHAVSILMVNYEAEHQAVPAQGRPVLGAPAKPCEKSSEALLSDGVSASVSEAFVQLRSATPTAQVPAQPKSVEDLMAELLRPMLKSWLDQNLPALVERLVQAEIERVTRSQA